MARYERFTFLLSKDERQLITELAERLRRSQSDAVRFVVLEAARELKAQHATPNVNQAAHEQAEAKLCKEPKMKRIFGLRVDYLIVGIVLGFLISISSVLVSPEWARSNITLIVLFPIGFSAATNLIANIRKAYE